MKKKDILQWAISQEDQVDGVRRRELEYTFYGQVKSLEDLKNNAFRKEEHEQWLIPLNTQLKVKARIRSIDGVRYILTSKTKIQGQLGSQEVECDISEDMFNSLKTVGTGGYKKTRYFFKVPGTKLIWEIDVFKNIAGQDHDWVKLDLEVPDENTQIPKLPVEFLTTISHQPKEYTPEEKSTVDNLWNNEWVAMDSDQYVKPT